MPRLRRYDLWGSCDAEPVLYHVTNRGVDHSDIFRSPADRIVFLAALAFCCLAYGLRVHCYCLMDNHFHLLLEDPRGKLSACVSRLQTIYARHFLDSRNRRGSGHLFKDRFFSRRVGSARYYDELVSYILLNPLRCTPSLAASAEAYLWSSAALHLGELPSADYFARILDAHGGLEAILKRLPKLSRREYEDNRRARFLALLSGEWIAPHAARFGRSPLQMRQILANRLARTASEAVALEDLSAAALEDGEQKEAASNPDTATLSNYPVQPTGIPRVTAIFDGAPLSIATERVLAECEAELAPASAEARALTSYLLWRFTSATRRQIAEQLQMSTELVRSWIERLRSGRRLDARFGPPLWRLEWRLYWQLPCSPRRA